MDSLHQLANELDVEPSLLKNAVRDVLYEQTIEDRVGFRSDERE